MTHKANGSVHFHQLKPSTQDNIALAQAVEERFLNLCGSWERIRGERLPIPDGLQNEMIAWRRMRIRHKQGDFRNSDYEVKCLRVFAQWTVDMNCCLRNQPLVKIDWGD